MIYTCLYAYSSYIDPSDQLFNLIQISKNVKWIQDIFNFASQISLNDN